MAAAVPIPSACRLDRWGTSPNGCWWRQALVGLQGPERPIGVGRAGVNRVGVGKVFNSEQGAAACNPLGDPTLSITARYSATV